MSYWPDDRKDMVRRLWADGNSATVISKMVGGISRNAVLGFLHRDGKLGTRPTASAPKAGASVRMSIPRAPKAVAPKLAAAKPAPRAVVQPFNPPLSANAGKSASDPIPMPPPELVVVGQAVVMSDIVRGDDGFLVERGLRASCCKYPVGPEPAIGEAHLQLFCAAPTGDAAKSYCDRHQAIAFKPSSAADKAKRLKGALNAAHRDMLTRNMRRNSSSTRAVF